MKRVIKDNYKFILGVIFGLIISISTVYAVDTYIESNKVAYTNHNKSNVEEAIDELYERSGVHKNKWIDPELNGADPILKAPLIPVEIKPNGDVYYASLNSEWYNYGEKRWANAIILVDSPSNANYKVGDHIIEDDIESYFVWIPRYQYKIWDMGQYTTLIEAETLTNQNYETSLIRAFNKPRIIDIKFGSVTNAPKMTESEATVNKYYTHPAFTLGNKDLNGIWVGKFESRYSETNNVLIKPNIIPTANKTAKAIFDIGYNYERNLDSHMMKNTEWGAVAYLSHSQYGIGTEIRKNNSSEYKTGSVMALIYDFDVDEYADSSETLPWNTDIGYLASTTGNISGVYDMNGGGSEIVAGCIENAVGKSEFNISELEQYMNNGYIDRYNSNSGKTTFNYRILGDATGELGEFYNYWTGAGKFARSGWYANFALFVFPEYPWFHRGGGPAQGIITGQFYFGSTPGQGGNTFRVSLAINNN